jgi:threonine dehydratase
MRQLGKMLESVSEEEVAETVKILAKKKLSQPKKVLGPAAAVNAAAPVTATSAPPA